MKKKICIIFFILFNNSYLTAQTSSQESLSLALLKSILAIQDYHTYFTSEEIKKGSKTWEMQVRTEGLYKWKKLIWGISIAEKNNLPLNLNDEILSLKKMQETRIYDSKISNKESIKPFLEKNISIEKIEEIILTQKKEMKDESFTIIEKIETCHDAKESFSICSKLSELKSFSQDDLKKYSEKIITELTVIEQKNVPVPKHYKIFAAAILVKAENYPEALRYLYDSQTTDISFRPLYKSVQEIYSSREKGLGQVHLKSF